MKINSINNINFRSFKKTYDYNEEFKKVTKIVEENPDAFQDPCTLEFISSKFATNPYYTPSEYINNFVYFKELETSDDEKWILNQPEDVSNISSDLFLNIDPTSKDASYLELIIELIENGYLNYNAMTFVKEGFGFNPHLKEDIDLYCDVVSKNKGEDLETELNNAYIPKVESEKEGIKTRKVGDAFCVEGEEFIRIKTSDNKSELMNITKEGYLKLFPIFDRFATSQGELSDCYLLETLEILYNNEKQRADLVKLFSEDKEGNFYIDINGVKTKFEDAKLPDSEIEENYPIGAPAYSMLEYAYGNYLQEEIFDTVREIYKDDEEKLEAFEEFIENNKNNVLVSFSKDKNDNYIPIITTIDKAKEEGLIDKLDLLTSRLNVQPWANSSIEFLIGNGGKPFELQDALGYKIDNFYNETSNKKFIKALLNSKNYMDGHFVTASINNHLYGIELSQNKNGNNVFHLYNPRNQSAPLVKSVDELLDIDDIKILFSTVD